MNSLFNFESSFTSVESRNAFYSIVDRTTPGLPSQGNVRFSDKDVSEFEAFFGQYINPISADDAFNPLLSDVVLDNTPSEYATPQSEAAVPQSQLPDPFRAMQCSQTFVYSPHPSYGDSLAPAQPIFDLSAFPSVRRLSVTEPEHPLPAESHTDASFHVACQLYPDILPSRLGMDALTPESHGPERCRVANCGETIDISLSSVCQHIAKSHANGPLYCQCGMFFKGVNANTELGWHIYHAHFYKENIICRACKVVRRPKDFAMHMRLCSSFVEYRAQREQRWGRGTRLEVDLTPVAPVAGVKRPAEVQVAFGQAMYQIGPLAKKFCTVMPSSIPARRKAKPAVAA
ncbi:hypothetical protein EV368DRAFT_82956 [Lentinula lateritia]|uniref:Uncharacterized protein n=1 Tax=Lentinula aff. lateritia TaxID=2804960 RepID=A0ACC1TYU0_9AGAR|nr:hypothetical protein F5876DRAFT_66057 [Lentinula aff. lateritia]KAJ3852001.1 hypothetical protein EV368DRAFT_82956 [Lentinula lateritia]